MICSSMYTVYGNRNSLGVLLYQTQRVCTGILSSFSLLPALISALPTFVT